MGAADEVRQYAAVKVMAFYESPVIVPERYGLLEERLSLPLKR